jgi:CubicO group peptidase (beta-lactamase class C family)
MIRSTLLLLPAILVAADVRTADIDRVLKDAIDRKAVPGVVAMVANDKGIVYTHAHGYDPDAIFAIASMTKPVTSVAVMQLVEAGKIKLDAPASTYAPDLAKVQVLDGGNLRAAAKPITVRQLLSHTAGFGYEFMNRDLAGFVQAGKAPSLMAGGDKFLAQPILFDPGAKWEYGINTDWLGRIVERVSGVSLEQYFQDHIFKPLGMKDTSFRVPADKQSRAARRYQRLDNGSFQELTAPPFPPSDFFSGGGGLFSTPADYMRFVRALLGGGQLDGKRILKASTVTEMGRNQIGDLTLRPFSSLAPQFATDNAALPGDLDKFGLGFALNSKPTASGRAANTMSWAGIFNTFFWIDRGKKVAAVVMTQYSPGLEEGARKLLEDFDRAVYAAMR